MNFLIVRCTVYDRAGDAMIQGAINGLQYLDSSSNIRALVVPKNDRKNPICPTYLDPDELTLGFEWADAILDCGGLCNGVDKQRLKYLRFAKVSKIPYIYMSQSFIDPDPIILIADLTIARGKRSQEVLKKRGCQAYVAPDLGFLVKPKIPSTACYVDGFTTYPNRDLQKMKKFLDANTSVQIVWKSPRNGKVFEPGLRIPSYTASVEYIFGMISTLRDIHTARYHAAVAGILTGVGVKIYPLQKNHSKYSDLLDWQGTSLDQLKKEALFGCELALEKTYECRNST